jgi:peptidoglycan/xylan/chitin deacetylase (PgdA/CDA1 family)
MPPQALRPQGPASDDAAVLGGRHRRAESLGDPRRARVTMEGPPPPTRPRAGDTRIAFPVTRSGAVPGPRSARHQRTAFIGDVPAGSVGSTDAWGDRRRVSAHRAAPVGQRPVTGSHRAPGTLPIESWLLMGKTRQQMLLASLVAVGILLVALPVEHGQDKVDAVRAAQQRAAASQSAKKNQDGDPAQRGSQTGDGRNGSAPAPGASASAGLPEATSTDPARRNGKAGPSQSLRTTGTRTVALTFDDGPDPEQTPKILALLAKYDVKATFCLVGQQVVKHPEIVRQIAAAGHTLCNHTWDHSLTIGKDKPAQIRTDLQRTADAIQAAVPGAAVPFFRAPGGNFTDRLVSVADEYDMSSLYWEVDPRDWDHPEDETDAAHVKRVVAEVRKHVRPGSIVLSHDFNQPDTVEAYEQLLPWLVDHYTLGIPGQRNAPPPSTAPDPGASPTAPEPSESASPAPSEDAQPPV